MNFDSVVLETLSQFILTSHDFLNFILACKRVKRHFCNESGQFKSQYLPLLLGLKVLLPREVRGKECVINIGNAAQAQHVFDLFVDALNVPLEDRHVLTKNGFVDELKVVQQKKVPVILTVAAWTDVPGSGGRQLGYYQYDREFQNDSDNLSKFPHVTSFILGDGSSFRGGGIPNYYIIDHALYKDIPDNSLDCFNKLGYTLYMILQRYENVILVLSTFHLYLKTDQYKLFFT